jgi:anaerobic nitric oxide reductase transcription regulator
MTTFKRSHFDITEVGMTTKGALLDSITMIISDLPKDLPAQERYEQLLTSMKKVFPFDAAALLKLEGQHLQPLAIKGLSDDVLGRRFAISEHPRLNQALHSHAPVHFASDSELPDPYDGLIESQEHNLDVHDCMGIALYIDDRPWGLLTLDAIEPGTFSKMDMEELSTFTHLTEAAIKAAERIKKMAAKAAHHKLVSQTLLAEPPSEMIGHSVSIIKLKEELNIVAQSELTVLVTGETGVGKELVARQVHRLSPRSRGPLIYVNCAALPENIAESELFGHVKGAFSGAISDRAGKFEIANGGTLFLDEIGELPLSLQPKLLRALQSGEIQRIGSDKLLQANVRIVAATNRNLEKEVAENRFRSDLFHRLSVYPVVVPPLRERGQDILLLAGYLLEMNQKRLGVQGLRLTPEAKQILINYPWPGNVRELEHMLSRSSLKAIAEQGRELRSIIIGKTHLDIKTAHNTSSQHQTEACTLHGISAPLSEANSLYFSAQGSLKDALDEFQRSFIEAVLERHKGNQASAARELGVNRSNFYRLLKRLSA